MDEINIGVYSNTISTILIVLGVAIITWFLLPYISPNHVSTTPDLDNMYCKDNLTYSLQMCDEFCIINYNDVKYGAGYSLSPEQQNITSFCKCCNYKLKYGEL